MKARDKLEEYIKKRASSISAFLEKPPQEFSSDDFHDLRVEIKKLKACFELIAFCAKKIDEKKYYKPFKIIFKQAGKIREMQIQESILKKYKLYASATGFENDFKAGYDIEYRNFSLLLYDELKAETNGMETTISPFFKNVREKCVDEMISRQKKKIKNLSGIKNLSALQVHELRRWIKEYVYLCKIFLPKDNSPEKIDALQDLLGKWHDYNVISANLENAINAKNLAEEEIKNIQILQKKISARAEKLLSEASSGFYTAFSS